MAKRKETFQEFEFGGRGENPVWANLQAVKEPSTEMLLCAVDATHREAVLTTQEHTQPVFILSRPRGLRYHCLSSIER